MDVWTKQNKTRDRTSLDAMDIIDNDARWEKKRIGGVVLVQQILIEYSLEI